MNLIELKNMSKNFDDLQVLKNINIRIQEGDFVAFLGPSGCGKSTLLSLISGLMEQSHGEIINKFPKQSMSFVFQEASLMPWCHIEKNIALPLELLGVHKSEIKIRVLNKLKMFQLEEYKTYFPRQISGGMKMRTSLARALVSNPKLLLLDEPFAALDEILREKCVEDVFEIWKTQNLTSILVTHSIHEAVYLCHKIFILSSGPAEIIEFIELDFQKQKVKNPDFKESEDFRNTCKKIRKIMEKFNNEPL